MEIKSAEYITHFESFNGKDPIPVSNPHFEVTYKDGSVQTVPTDIRNMDTQALAQWYGKQKKKPFVFDFEVAS